MLQVLLLLMLKSGGSLGTFYKRSKNRSGRRNVIVASIPYASYRRRGYQRGPRLIRVPHIQRKY